MTVRAFSAVADCPKCGLLDIHWLDDPKPEPTHDDVWAYGRKVRAHINDPGDKIVSWCGTVVRQVGGTPHPGPPPVDESGFEVMRVCTACQHRWGET